MQGCWLHADIIVDISAFFYYYNYFDLLILFFCMVYNLTLIYILCLILLLLFCTAFGLFFILWWVQLYFIYINMYIYRKLRALFLSPVRIMRFSMCFFLSHLNIKICQVITIMICITIFAFPSFNCPSLLCYLFLYKL
jgi:hypothetical protein